ncbi:MAG: hypothetical protein FWC82_04135 [Firmicutes bacterium]|nr:hypothetical protein [Bacillota bacterium]
MTWTQAHNQTVDANQVVAKRSTRYIVFLVVMSCIILALSAFAFVVLISFGLSELGLAGALFLILFIGLLVAVSIIFLSVAICFAVVIPPVLIKIIDGNLYLCPKRRVSIPTHPLSIDKIDYRLYANALHYVLTTIITLGNIMAGKAGKSGRLVIVAKDNLKIRLRFVKNAESVYHFLLGLLAD